VHTEAKATFPFVAPVKVALAGTGAHTPAAMSKIPSSAKARGLARIAFRSTSGVLDVFK